MTLLEAIVAMVILSLVGVGCLELAHGASQLQSSSVEWEAAISEAESRMASVLAAAPIAPSPSMAPWAVGSRAGRATSITRTAWRNGLDQIAVTVAIDDGRSFTLRRLVPSARSLR